MCQTMPFSTLLTMPHTLYILFSNSLRHESSAIDFVLHHENFVLHHENFVKQRNGVIIAFIQTPFTPTYIPHYFEKNPIPTTDIAPLFSVSIESNFAVLIQLKIKTIEMHAEDLLYIDIVMQNVPPLLQNHKANGSLDNADFDLYKHIANLTIRKAP